ncbi:uncharacterized protein [Dendrobates tinctorius]|uniref:uncharacterized protein n=1 Tax=Dendrobates tinctorius TaxID=92724 RepID=UPI003CCA2542
MDRNVIEFCIELLTLVLTKNYFLFGDTFYLQTKGTAMGSNVAPPYANTFMATFEEDIVYPDPSFKTHCKLWKRFIDDIFCIWTGPADTLDTFFNTLNMAWPGLSFTMTRDEHTVSFLDTRIIKNTEGYLSTDLYVKTTDRNSLLHYRSLHPPSTKRSIPVSQFKRVERIVSDPTTSNIRLNEMHNKFRTRGYPSDLLDQARQPPIRHRSGVSGRLPFVHTYHPYVQILHHSICRHWGILKEAHPEVTEFQQNFLPCYKRPKNIRDTLIRADIGSGVRSTTQRFLSTPKTGTYPCLHCNQCNNVLKGDYLHHPHSGKRYQIKDFSTCDTSNVVYLIKCPCGLLYIGETTQSIRDRISKHKSTIRCGNTLLPIPHHFITAGHTIPQLKFCVIEHVPPPRRGGNRIQLLKRREAFWIHELHTLAPKGLNRDYDLLSFI